jgi:hypothetical protein
MSTFVIQIITKQWDKSQQSQQHQAERAALPNRYPLNRQSAFYAFDKQCVIDVHGDDIMGNRLTYAQIDADTIQIDRFRISLPNKILHYIEPESEAEPQNMGCLNEHLQCSYQWRHRVFEGGFFYWLYEQVTVNFMSTDKVEQDLFMQTEPKQLALDYANRA